MNIALYRSSFLVNVITAEGFDPEHFSDYLQRARYNVTEQNWEQVSELLQNPPHMLVTYWESGQDKIKDQLEQVHAQLPETHIFVLTPTYCLAEAVETFRNVAYDCLTYPLLSQLNLLRALDRAAERDFYMYSCEQKGITFAANTEEPGQQKFTEELLKTKSLEEIIDVGLDRIHEILPNVPVVFFKYFAHRRSLVLASDRGFGKRKPSGVGLNFNELEEDFKVRDLIEPKNIGSFRQMVQHVFETDDFQTQILRVKETPSGLFLFLTRQPNVVDVPGMNLVMTQLHHHLKLIDLERRVHIISTRDEATDVLHRQAFLETIGLEVARARRTQLPVSIALIKIDQLPQIAKSFGREEAELVMKMLAKIFRKYSRVNDLIGRTGSDEFGLLLPHTPRQGAAIKAERIRRIVESADFSRMMKKMIPVTVSCGVSEYPTLCRDADELLSTSDAALYEVRQSNRVCLASVSEGFVADFIVPEPDWLERGSASS